MGIVCGNEGISLKQRSMGGGMADVSQTGRVGKSVCCGSRNCKTCYHLIEDSTFTSIVTGRRYIPCEHPGNVHELWNEECDIFDFM